MKNVFWVTTARFSGAGAKGAATEPLERKKARAAGARALHGYSRGHLCRRRTSPDRPRVV